MQNVISVGVIYFALSILSCNEKKEKLHGLEKINTLINLQKSHSNQAIADFLAKYPEWKRMDNDSTIGYGWRYATSNSSNLHVRGADLMIINTDGIFRLTLDFGERDLFNQYVDQLSQGSPYSLIHKIDMHGQEIRFYEGNGCSITVGGRDYSYHLTIRPPL